MTGVRTTHPSPGRAPSALRVFILQLTYAYGKKESSKKEGEEKLEEAPIISIVKPRAANVARGFLLHDRLCAACYDKRHHARFQETPCWDEPAS